MGKLSGEEKGALGVGCFVLLINVAWIGFLIWAIVELVLWLTSK